MRPSGFDAHSAEAEETSNIEILKELWDYIWPSGKTAYKPRIVFAMLCLILAKVCNVYLPVLYKDIVNHFEGEASIVSVPLLLIGAYGCVRLSQSIFNELRDLLFVRVTQNTRRTIGLKVFAHLHNLPLQFHLERQTGGLSRVIERGTRGVRFVMSFLVFNIGPTIFELLLVVVMMSYLLNWLFALIILVTVICYIAWTFSLTEWRLKYRRQMNAKDSEANTMAIDSLLNFETVKYFASEKYEYDRYNSSLKDFESSAIKSQASLFALNSGQQTIIAAGVVGTMWMAADGLAAKELSLGEFVMVNTFMLQLFIPLNFLGFVYREIKQSLINMDKMFQILKIVPTIKDGEKAIDQSSDSFRVEFDRVCFSYGDGRAIIKDLSLSIEAGQKIAVVGPSGGGKSTIAKLIMRFYDVTSGTIRINGNNIKAYTLEGLRKKIAVVPQDTVLFNDTLYYNIAYGNPAANEAEVKEAVAKAQLSEFVAALPKGLETKVGERGLKLSGGEKQRVAIARAILKNAALLILDEATSALDSNTELAIQTALKNLTVGRTSLVIAHRLSTVTDADRIIVVDEGQIVDQGTHTELLERSELYSELWKKQV